MDATEYRFRRLEMAIIENEERLHRKIKIACRWLENDGAVCDQDRVNKVLDMLLDRGEFEKGKT